jgi:hypothetical protein
LRISISVILDERLESYRNAVPVLIFGNRQTRNHPSGASVISWMPQ